MLIMRCHFYTLFNKSERVVLMEVEMSVVVMSLAMEMITQRPAVLSRNASGYSTVHTHCGYATPRLTHTVFVLLCACERTQL